MRRSPFLVLMVTLLACSSSGSDTSPDGPTAAECRGDLPEVLSVSEGGLLTFPRRADVTYEATGGAVILLEDAKVHVRAPYIAGADGDVALVLGCGQTIPLELRPLAWTRLAAWEEDTGAKAREYGAWWIDQEASGALVVFGGFHYLPQQFTPANDAWRFDFATSAWSPLAGPDLPTMPGGRAAPIPGERAVLFFGGTKPKADRSLETPPSLYRFDYDDDRVTPTKLDVAGDAVGSYTGSFMYDTKRSRWLSVCGASSTEGLNCLVHAYTKEAGFTRVQVSGAPPSGRYGFDYAYDEATDRVILFGGQDGAADADIDGETWALDLASEPAAWTRLFADGEGAMKRRNGAFALDPVGHRLFVWGGTPDGATSVKNLQVLTLDRGAEAWSDVETPSDVRSRTSGLGIYDAARDRILFGFGNDRAIYRDLWSLDTANLR